MFTEPEIDDTTAQSAISTGHMPPDPQVAALGQKSLRLLQVS